MSSPSAQPIVPSPARRFVIEGETISYPTEFRDGSSAAGLFLVDSAQANEFIADSGFRIAEVAPGRGVLAITGVHLEFNPSMQHIDRMLLRDSFPDGFRTDLQLASDIAHAAITLLHELHGLGLELVREASSTSLLGHLELPMED
jgi:hypothetical protein